MNTLRSTFALLFFSTTSIISPAQEYNELQKIFSSDPHLGEIFGFNLEIEASTAVIGAPFDLSQKGSADIYQRNNDGVWTHAKRLLPSDAVNQNEFGYTVDVSGENIVVGTFLGVLGGAVYVFNRNHGGTDNWGELKKLDGSNSGFENDFGVTFSLDGDYLIVGEPAEVINSNQNAGQVHLFYKDQGGFNNWGLLKTFSSDNPLAQQRFGKETSISKDFVAIGSRNPVNQVNVVTIHYKNQGGPDAWEKLLEFELPAGPGSGFDGKSLELQDDLLVVGNPNEEDGVAYIHCKDCGGQNSWGLLKRIEPGSLTNQAKFGGTVNIDNKSILVSSHADNQKGAVYMFHRNVGGANNWGMLSKLVASDGELNDNFGTDVAMSNDVALIGAQADDDQGTNAGAAYFFGVVCNTDNDVSIQVSEENLFIDSQGDNGIIMKDIAGGCWKVTINVNGELVSCEVDCPD